MTEKITGGFDSRFALTGKFLVSMPTLDGSDCFKRSVVYICSHSSNGAMGLIVNKRMDKFTFSDLTFQLPVKNYEALNEVNLYTGGPLEQVRGMVLHTTDYMRDGTVMVADGLAVSSTSEIISDIAFGQGPKEKLVALGYSFWQPRQLEAEIYDNNWLVVNADKDIIFRTPDEEKWQRALDESRISLDRFVNETGHG
ncbi:MAG: YqgE/AlgH family protein [Pseudomonadota bacterium]|nr:YqgE/AlgH family protein [Pseudomonadota bacterium]